MIGVDWKGLPAWRMLLHLRLQFERYRTFALALNVVATPPMLWPTKITFSSGAEAISGLYGQWT